MAKVAVLKTTHSTVVEDYGRLMRSVSYSESIQNTRRTVLKLNLSWTLFYPACSTPPWQIDGLLKTMLEDGFKDIVAVENKTVVTKPTKGAINNKWLPVLEKHGQKFVSLTDVEWVEYQPKSTLLALDSKVFDRVEIPKLFIGSNVIHLPTQKTHGHTVTTGAIKNAFGGLLKEVRHHCHTYIHEILVDLLTIQKEIHPGIFAVMDGAVAGDGAGPRTMAPKVKNYILASEDQVAIDAISAKMMGFDPMKIGYIRMAHDKGLGMGDPDQIDVVGEDISAVNYGFSVSRSPIIWGDQMVRRGSLRLLEPLLHTKLFIVPRLLSEMYHDYYWYPFKGKKAVREFMSTDWGKLFARY
ncbi:MAG: DUF362 domain-containing protein [Thermoplasmata archaeon]|nr:DUF362 domain-containing protein [Thermoplasmata archaeon]